MLANRNMKFFHNTRLRYTISCFNSSAIIVTRRHSTKQEEDGRYKKKATDQRTTEASSTRAVLHFLISIFFGSIVLGSQIMSESNQSPQSPKVKALAPPPQEGGSNGEFVVHTKHTCDMCFRLPIIGQRYASEVQPNFDLCARCLEAYSGPVIGLTEAVLSKSGLWQHRHFNALLSDGQFSLKIHFFVCDHLTLQSGTRSSAVTSC